MPRLDRPGAPLHRAARVEDGQVELGPLGDPVEHHRPERRRLGNHHRQPHRPVGPTAARASVAAASALGARRAPAPQPRGAHGAGASGRGGAPRARGRLVGAAVPGAQSDQAAARRASRPPWRRLERRRRARRARSAASAAAPSGTGPARPGEPRELRPLADRAAGASAAIWRSATRRWHSRWSSRAPRRRLRRVLAVEDERLAHVVSIGNGEQPRPEVVVLALAERRCRSGGRARRAPARSTTTRRVEERRGEERRPPHGARPGRHPVDRPEAPVRRAGRSSPCPTTAAAGADPDARDDPLEPAGQRDVVGVHPREERRRAPRRSPTLSAPARPSGSSFRTTRSRSSSIASSTAAVPSTEPSSTTRSSRSAQRLAEHAPHRLLDRRLGVAGGHHDGHERSGHGGLRVACAGGGSGLRSPLRPRRRDRRPHGRPRERCSHSLEAQTHRRFRLVVVDQNADARVADVLAAHPALDDPPPPLRAGPLARAERRAART